MKNSHPSCDTLIFDLFGVVIAFDEDQVYRRISEFASDTAAAFKAIRGLVSNPELIRGRITLKNIHEQLCVSQGLNLDFVSFESLWMVPYSEPMRGMAELLEELSKSFQLILLSNVDRYYWQVVARNHPELALFTKRLLSWEMGMAKPDLPVFEHALIAADCLASRCFFIDDKIENINAAHTLGILGHTFTNVIALRAELSLNGIY